MAIGVDPSRHLDDTSAAVGGIARASMRPRSRPGRAGTRPPTAPAITDDPRGRGRTARPLDGPRTSTTPRPGPASSTLRPADGPDADRLAGHGTSCTALRSRPPVAATLGLARPSTAGSPAVLEEARSRLARNDGAAAVALLEEAVADPGPGRDAILEAAPPGLRDGRDRPRSPAAPARPKPIART